MARWLHCVAPMAVAVLMVPAWAQNSGGVEGADAMPSINANIKRVDSQVLRANADSLRRRADIAQRANNVFTLYAGELALTKGQVGTALSTYMAMMERTHDPEVAERALDIAVSVGARVQAEAIWARWQQLDTDENSVVRRRMRWQMALLNGDVATVVAGLPQALAEANEYALRRIFLQMAQLSLRDQSVAEQAYPAIHQSAREHADLPEAMIADALFSALSAHQQDAVVALRYLAQLDNRLQPATQLTLGLISVRQPQVLQAFFRQTDPRSLSPLWQSMYIDALMGSNKLPEAYRQIQPLLAAGNSADLYLKAGFLSVSQKASIDTTLGYLSKAYALGNTAQQSKAAFLAAMRFLDDHNTAAARAWVDKIRDDAYRFDKTLLLASIEGEEGHWSAAQRQLDVARGLDVAKGVFFDQDDLWRLQFLQFRHAAKPAQMLPQINRWLGVAQQSGKTEQVASLLYLRGLLYADELHQAQKAVADLRRFNELKPNNAAGLNALGYTMLSLPQRYWPQAQALIEQAYQLDSQSPAINDSLGWAYFLNGDVERALPYLQFAFRQQPEPEVAAHLGEVLWRLGQRDEAKVVWQSGMRAEGDQRLLKATLRRLGVVLAPAVSAPADTAAAGSTR